MTGFLVNMYVCLRHATYHHNVPVVMNVCSPFNFFSGMIFFFIYSFIVFMIFGKIT